MSRAEEDLAWRLDVLQIPYEREKIFRGINEDRRWRFDFLLQPEELKIAIEVEGGVFVGGRHTRGQGFTNDLIKYNEAAIMGYMVLRYTTAQINGVALDQIPMVYKSRLKALQSFSQTSHQGTLRPSSSSV